MGRACPRRDFNAAMEGGRGLAVSAAKGKALRAAADCKNRRRVGIVNYVTNFGFFWTSFSLSKPQPRYDREEMNHLRRSRRTEALVALAILLPVVLSGQQLSTEPVISDAEIIQLLTDRIDQKQQSVGMVVGVIEDRGERIVSQGALNQGDPRTLGANTTFEIGGLTSIFTSLLLADITPRSTWRSPIRFPNIYQPPSKFRPWDLGKLPWPI